MARSFNDASSEYLQLDSAPVTAVPLTMACWFRTDQIALGTALINLADASQGGFWFCLYFAGGVALDPVGAYISDAGGTEAAVTTTGVTINTWHHAAAVYSAIDARAAYIDGGSKGTNAVSVTPTGIDRVCIGRKGDSSPEAYMSGYIAEAAIWSAALTDAEIATLALGINPLYVRGASLVAYWPLLGTDRDWVGSYNLTAYNTPSWADHPMKARGIGRRMRSLTTFTPAAGGLPPMAMRHYWGLRV